MFKDKLKALHKAQDREFVLETLSYLLMFVGFFTIIGSLGSYEQMRMTFMETIPYISLGAILTYIGVKIVDKCLDEEEDD